MRWLFRLLGVVVVLALLALGALALVPAERIAQLAAERFAAATGRTLRIDGPVRPSLWPVIGVRAADVAIGNADWAGDAPMIEARALAVGVAARPLLSGRIEVVELRLEAPVIRLERDASGRANWEFAPPGNGDAQAAGAGAADQPSLQAGSQEGTGAGVLEGLALREVAISQGRLTFRDAAAGLELAADAIDLKGAVAGRAELAGSLRLNGAPLEIALELDDVHAFLAGRVSNARLTVQGDAATLRYAGRIGASGMDAQGRIEADLPDIDAALRLAGLAAPGLPGKWNAARIAADATLTQGAQLALRGLDATLGGTPVAGDADIDLRGARPKLVARLSTGTIDLRPFLNAGGSAPASGAAGGQGGASAPARAPAAGAQASGWPTDPLDLSALGLADFDIRLSAKGLATGMSDLSAISARITGERGRAVVQLEQAALYDGTLAGQFVANARNGLSVSADARLRGVNLLPFLQQAAGFDRLAGTGNMDIKVLGVGGTVDAIMRSLKGSARIDLGRGEIIGFDLAGMIRNLDASYRGGSNKTIYESITASFAIADGVAANDDLKFRSSILDVAGAGRIDLGNQRIDYTLTPTRFDTQGQQIEPVLVPVRITGPWSAPAFRPDLEKALQAGIDGKIGEAEKAARQKVQEEIKRAVGAEGAGSVEEAVKQKVEQAIKNELGKALGGFLKQ